MSNGRPDISVKTSQTVKRAPPPRASTIPSASCPADPKLRVYLAAENRLLLEALSCVLAKTGTIEVIGEHSSFDVHALLASQAEILLLSSRGSVAENLTTIQTVRSSTSSVRILLMGMPRDESEFLQCVAAGISGYLLLDASSEEVLAGIHSVRQGAAVCPGALCTVLFRYFEQAAPGSPLGSLHRHLRLTRRERQLLPLLAEGLTNKEIAERLRLSEQTIKNHLFRMKQKTGGEDRMDLVQRSSMQGLATTRSEKNS
jgi:DNA-binding NarL/FixJ family response regulator